MTVETIEYSFCQLRFDFLQALKRQRIIDTRIAISCTIWKQNNPRLISDICWISLSYFCDCIEKFYYKILCKIIYLLFTIYSISILFCNISLFSSQQLSCQLDFCSYNSNQSCVFRIFYLSLEQSRIFCWKNCTVYELGIALIEFDSFDILDREY